MVGCASLLSLAGIIVAPPAQAAVIDFRDWRPLGDANRQKGSLSISTNRLNGDDDLKNDGVISPDIDFNYSGHPAVEISQLEAALGLSLMGLNPKPSQPALEGSLIINTELNLTQPTTFSFDWTFFTNETAATNEQGEIDPLPDYAFIVINGVITSLANALQSLFLSNSTYQSEISGGFSHMLAAGAYSIAFGVVDISDKVVSSALVVSKAQLISHPPDSPSPIDPNHPTDPSLPPDVVTIPEPSSVLALFLCGGLGVGTRVWKSQQAKQSDKP